jgi:hypothetical protein
MPLILLHILVQKIISTCSEKGPEYSIHSHEITFLHYLAKYLCDLA